MSTSECVLPPISFTLNNFRKYTMTDKIGSLENSATINFNKSTIPYALNSIEFNVLSINKEITVNNVKKNYIVNKVINISRIKFLNLKDFSVTEWELINFGGNIQNYKSNEVKTITIPSQESNTRIIYDIEFLYGCRVGNETFLSSRYVSGVNVKYYEFTDLYTLKQSGITPRTVTESDVIKRHSISLHDFPYNFVGKMLNKINLSYDDTGIGFPTDDWEIATLKVNDSNIKFSNEQQIRDFMELVTTCASWRWTGNNVAKKVTIKISDITSVAPLGVANYSINTNMPYGVTINTGENIWFSLLFYKSYKCVTRTGDSYQSKYMAGIVYGFENESNNIPIINAVDLSKLPSLYIPADPYLQGLYEPYCNTNKCNTDYDCDGLTPFCLQGKCVNCATDSNCPVDMYCTPKSFVCASTKQCNEDTDCKTIGLDFCIDSSHGKRCGNCRMNRNEDCKRFGDKFQCGIDNVCINMEDVKQCDESKKCPEDFKCNKIGECENLNECVDNGDCYCGYICKNGKFIERALPDECKTDAECRVGFVCSSNKCTTQYDGCKNSSECNKNQICSNNQCVPVISECEIDSDCPFGLTCENKNCRILKPIKFSFLQNLFGDFLFWIVILFLIMALFFIKF